MPSSSLSSSLSHDAHQTMVNALDRSDGTLADLDQALAAGADVNAPVSVPRDGMDPLTTTPLLLALIRGKDDGWVRRLLNAGADPSRTDNEARDPLHECVRANRASTVARLVRAGADTSVEYGGYLRTHSILHIAARNDGGAAVVRALVKAGLPVDQQDSNGDTPLHQAAWTGQEDNVRALLALGADVTARNRHQETPLDLVRSLTDQPVFDTVRMLLENTELRLAVPDLVFPATARRPRL